MAKYGKDAALEDLARALAYQDAITASASKHGLDPAFVASIGSRETRWMARYFLGDQDPVTGQYRGHGPMQIDIRSYRAWCLDYQAGKLEPIDGIDKGCEVAASMRDALFGATHSLVMADKVLSSTDQLVAIACAYNAGAARVAKLINEGLDPDAVTTGHNYGSDVVSRMSVFSDNGFVKPVIATPMSSIDKP